MVVPTIPEEPEIAIVEPSQVQPIISSSQTPQVNPPTIHGTSQENPPSMPGTSQENPIFISETSPENPPSIAGPSQRNPSTNVFSFELKPAGKLKLALQALCDTEFNEYGLGRIDVDHENGFEIAVHNAASRVTGTLSLRASNLINFKCCKPVEGKIVQLTEISENLVAGDEDTVSIYHVDGSSELWFMFGDAPSRGFSVEFLETNAEIEKSPYVISFCELVIPCNDLREMIPILVHEGNAQKVQVDMKSTSATVLVGKYDLWDYDYDGKTGESRGMKLGQRHLGSFYLTHGDMLEKASLLDVFILCLLMKPPNHVMLHFSLLELGDLVYIKRADSVRANFEPAPVSSTSQTTKS